MDRHIAAYLYVLILYYFPSVIANPKGAMYFVSISAWCYIASKIYLKFIRLRCATILALLELSVVACAMIACIEYSLSFNGFFYKNIENIVDLLVTIEVLVITSSLVGTKIGTFGAGRYNKHNRRSNSNSAHFY